MKPSELLRAAVPYLAQDQADFDGRYESARGLCDAVRFVPGTQYQERAIVCAEIRWLLKPHWWAEEWLAHNGAPKALLTHSDDPINPAVQRWRAMWAEKLAQQFEERGE